MIALLLLLFTFFLHGHIVCMQVLGLFWCPCNLTLNIIIMFVCTWKIYHAVYTHCIGRIHSLATTSGLVRKMGVISIIVGTSESKDHVYRRENLASIAIKQIQCLHALVAQNNLRTFFCTIQVHIIIYAKIIDN